MVLRCTAVLFTGQKVLETHTFSPHPTQYPPVSRPLLCWKHSVMVGERWVMMPRTADRGPRIPFSLGAARPQPLIIYERCISSWHVAQRTLINLRAQRTQQHNPPPLPARCVLKRPYNSMAPFSRFDMCRKQTNVARTWRSSRSFFIAVIGLAVTTHGFLPTAPQLPSAQVQSLRKVRACFALVLSIIGVSVPFFLPGGAYSSRVPGFQVHV